MAITTEDLLRSDLDVLNHGGQEAISLFLEMSRRLHETGQVEALHDWITVAAPALPERERGEVMTLLMYGYLYMNYQIQPRTISGLAIECTDNRPEVRACGEQSSTKDSTMDKYDEYRKRAHEAHMMADQSTKEHDKAAWLRVAQGWMELLLKPTQSESAEQRFDAHSKARGTGQEDSKESH
jgi:hypothetical protein